MFLRQVRRWLLRSLAFTGLITVIVLVTPVVSWWAQAYAGSFAHPTGDILILLSAAPDDEGVISYSSYWRARYVLLAWRTGRFKRVIVTGGGPRIAEFLEAEGIPQEAITAEWQSSSTHESALAMAKLLGALPGKKVLVTSDFHMYRSLRVFHRCGLAVEPMPVPDVVDEDLYWRFNGFETMLIETTKIAYYAVRGWL